MNSTTPQKDLSGNKKKGKVRVKVQQDPDTTDKKRQPAEPKMKAMKSLTVEEGRVATLKCEVGAGNPTPKIKLYDKEGVELTAEEAKLRDAKLKSKKRGKVLEYQIRKTSQSHAGPYLCEARNNLGKASTTGNLTLIQAAATSTTPAVKTSSHVTPCSDAHKNYCVNGGECFTLEVTPGSPKFLCRCLSGFTGNRCQATVPVRVMNPKQHLGIEFMEAEELYQKRVLTITGICIALLVVGIMCVVAYCKTKKQRKKFQDRLRQSIRSERNHMASSADNGAWPPAPSNPPPPPENVQLVNQYLSKNAMPAQHAVEKESETSFSTSQYTSSAPQRSTTVTRTASQCWTNGRSESVPSDTRSASVRSSASGSQRGRLHGTAGANGVKASAAPPRVCGDTPMDCCRDSPYSERYVSAMTTPTRPSPAHPAPPLSPVTPGSPPSEASAPLSSVATSVAVTPAADEERPLLFATPPRPRDRQKRNSAHYNHGLEAASPPASPLAAVRDDDYQITHEHELRQDGPGEAGGLTAAAATAAPPAASPHGLPTKLTGNSSNNNNGRQAKRTKASAGRRAADGDPGRSSSESETEDEQAGEDTPFLSLQNPMVLGLALSLEVAPSSSSSSSSSSSDSSRTNPALLLSPQDELQARLSSAIAHQDPIAV